MRSIDVDFGNRLIKESQLKWVMSVGMVTIGWSPRPPIALLALQAPKRAPSSTSPAASAPALAPAPTPALVPFLPLAWVLTVAHERAPWRPGHTRC